MNTQAASPRWAVRVLLYIMLLISAAAAFLLNDRLWAAARVGSLPVWAPLLPVLCFTAFVLVYAVDRYLLIRRRGYPLMGAFFQLGLMVLFLTLLWPEQAAQFRGARAQVANEDVSLRLLGHQESAVRAAACELMGLRAQTSALARVTEMSEHDSAAEVRTSCGEAAQRLRAVGGAP